MSLPAPAEIPEQLSLASRDWVKLRRMASYAAFDGWTLTILGALSLVCGGYSSASGLLVSSVLLGTGLFEIRSVRRLRRLDPDSIIHLGYNQFVLAGVLVLYAIISLIQSYRGAMPSEVMNAIAEVGGSTEDTKKTLVAAMEIFYAALIAFTLLVQGGTALYYLSRRKLFLQYLEKTPEWIQKMQRERGEVSL
jgi:hypothetical protein